LHLALFEQPVKDNFVNSLLECCVVETFLSPRTTEVAPAFRIPDISGLINQTPTFYMTISSMGDEEEQAMF
jgi:hypothetical protein